MQLQTDRSSDRAASELKRKTSPRYGGVAAILALGLVLIVGACSSGAGHAQATNPVPYMSKDSRHFLLSVPATPTPVVTVAVPTPTPTPEPTAAPESAAAPTAIAEVTDGGTPTAEDLASELAATPTPEPAEEPAEGPDQEELIEQGKLIFLETAGGVGCQYCHGPDGSGMVGPDIRGATGLMVQGALDRAPDMLFITLEPWEFYAIEAYLATLVP